MKKHLTLLKALFLFMAFAFALQAQAQDVKVTGKVTDATDGSTLPGVSIAVKGTTTGTVTDIDGKYSLSAKSGSTLVFSFVGYAPQEIILTGQQNLNVALKPSVTGLNEVVVIGYGQVKKGDATGSVQAIGSKDFNRGVITSPSDLLVGKVAGVQITSNSGAPGSGATIRIRGGSSLSASNDPLFVIDGIPVDNGGIDGTRNPLSTINPNDIESFTVLKDASATAIYGSRASNGVIIITTKKGQGGSTKSGLPFNLEYSGSMSYYSIPKTLDVLSGDEFRSVINEKYAGKDNVLSLLGEANTDWQKEILKSSIGMDHYVSANGAYKTMPYRLSLGYSDHNGILKNDNMKRTNLGFGVNPTLFDKHLKIDVNGKASFMKQRFGNEGAIGAAVQCDPTQPIYDEGNAYGGYWARLQANGDPVTQATANPVALVDLVDDRSDVKRYLANAQFDYKFHFLPELRANLNLGYDYSTSTGSVYTPYFAAFSFDKVNGGGSIRDYDQEKKNEILDFTLNYVKDVASLKSKFDLMGGYSWQRFWTKSSSHSFNDTTSATMINKVTNPANLYEGENYLVSFFGRFNYTLMDRYLLTFTLRDDGSSRFSSDNRWGLFPAAAFAWKIIDEPWMKSSTAFSQLKLRLGYGLTGQQNIGGSLFPYLPIYVYSNEYAAYQFGNEFVITARPSGYDANIKWEETTTLNAGLEFGFAKDRIFGSFEVYKRKTKDLINWIPVPAGTNLTNYITTNVGDLENTGFELSLTGRPIVKENMFWELSLNAAYNENKITKLTATDDTTYLGVLTGGISGGVGNTIQIHSVGYPANSFFVYEQVYDVNGKPIEGMYVDRNGDGQITDADRYHYKNAAAKVTFGIASRFNYKNWDFAFSGRANFGNYVYDNMKSNNAVYERLYRPEGPYLANILTEVEETGFVVPQYLSDYYIKDASFFKMDNITLAYTFKKFFRDKVALKLSATVNNAFTITDYTGLDPEIGNGIDNNMYPRTRAFVFGLNLQF